MIPIKIIYTTDIDNLRFTLNATKRLYDNDINDQYQQEYIYRQRLQQLGVL